MARHLEKSIGIALAFLLAFFLFCGKAKQESEKAPETEKAASFIHGITSEDEFKRIIESSGDRLIVFDLYANWCRPCRILSPVLEKIAAANVARTTFFKIDVDKFPGIAGSFGGEGIPHVVFVKNKAVVESLIGLQPEQGYIDVIDRLAGR